MNLSSGGVLPGLWKLFPRMIAPALVRRAAVLFLSYFYSSCTTFLSFFPYPTPFFSYFRVEFLREFFYDSFVACWENNFDLFFFLFSFMRCTIRLYVR